MTDYIYQLDAYDYELPGDRIAQFPEIERDQSKLLILESDINAPKHGHFADITQYLREGDLLVVNATKVFPARLLGRKESGGKAELFLLHFPRQLSVEDTCQTWHEATALTLVKSSKRPKIGSTLLFSDDLLARIDNFTEEGKVEVTLQYRLGAHASLEELLQSQGQIPLPPYISRPQGSLAEDIDRYQTRYARETGSVAAPTAGLHFSDALLTEIREIGVDVAQVILHVGYGTFAPVRTEDIRKHRIHREWIEINQETATLINRKKTAGSRVWAVGTTTVRTLEFAAKNTGAVQAISGEVRSLYLSRFFFSGN